MFVSPKLLWKRSSGDGIWGLSISTDIYQSTSEMVSVCTTNQPTMQTEKTFNELQARSYSDVLRE